MTDSIRTTPSTSVPFRKRQQARVLEPRVMFDAAAVETLATVTADATPEPVPAVDTSVLFDAPAVTGLREAYVIDTSVQGYEALLAQVPAGAELFLIDASKPGLEQLNTALASAGGSFDAIHVISHGTGGSLKLGSDIISNATLDSYATALQTLGDHLTAEGDLLLYGCDIAGTADGATFLAELSTLTGADVAASTDATAGPNGDVDLEALAGTGSLETNPWAPVSVLDAPLALDGIYAGLQEGDAGQADQLGWALDGSGEWVVAAGNGTGEVQVWRVVGNTQIEQKIVLPDATTAPLAVSMDGNTFVVGNPSAGTAGRIYVYRLNTSTLQWAWAQTLDVAALTGVTADSRIGAAGIGNYSSNQWLAVSGIHIAVGSSNEGGGSGRVIWFADKSSNLDWSDTSATGLGRGVFDEPGGYNDDSNPRFGASVAIAQDVLVVGAPGADRDGDDGYLGGGNTGNQGAVFVYNWSANSDTAPASIAYTLGGNADAGGGFAQNAYFGAAIDIEYYKDVNNAAAPYKYTIVAGAPGEDGNRGEVYIYQTSSAAIGTLNTSASNIYGQTTGGGADFYGLATAVSQGRVVVGAPLHNAATDAGVFYYESSTNNWTGLNTNNPAGFGIFVKSWTAASFGSAATDDRFGRSLSFSGGNNVTAGAPQFGTDNRGGVAFFFARTPVAVSDLTYSISEDAASTLFNPKSNDFYGTETDATVTVTPILPGGIKGVLTWAADATTFTFNPNGQYEYLSAGQSEVITFSYKLTTTSGGVTFSTIADVSITITGVNDAPTAGDGIDAITVPRLNEPNGNPSGAATPSSGTVEIPFSAFSDADQADTLTYSALSIAQVGGAAIAAPSINPTTGNIRVTGSYNKVTGTNTGLITYNLTGLGTGYQETSWSITVQVNDGNGGLTTTTLVFNIGRDNQNPETQAITAPNATEDAVYTFDLDPDNNPNTFPFFRDPDTTTGTYPESLTYSIVSQSGPGVDWLSISADGVLSGAPSNDNVGVHSVVIKATDIFGNSINSSPFNITVVNTNDAPLLVNEIDRKISIKGETFGFNVQSGVVSWNGIAQTNDDVGPYPSPNNFFYDADNSTLDGRSPSSGETIIYTAFNAVTNEVINIGSGGVTNSFNDTSWLRFNGTSFSGTPTNPLGSVITVRLVATDSNGTPLSTSTVFEIGVFPRDGASAEGPLPGTPTNGGQLGYDVAINSGDGTVQGTAGRWAVVGEPGSDSSNGRIRIYENTAYATATAAPVWVERATYTTTAADARLGASVDINAGGTRIVAGAPNEAGGGAVYYFHYGVDSAADADTSPWEAGHQAATPVYKVVSPDANAGDGFGSAVAINQDGSQVVVGAPLDDAAGTNAGAAYLFNWGVATGAGKLMPTVDGTELASARAGDQFGYSVAFDQDMVVVGAPRDDHSGKQDAGSVYVYSRALTSEFVKLKKVATDVNNFDYFGTSVDVDSFATNNSVVVAVGTPKDDRAGTDSGAVYIFRSDTMSTDIGNGGGLTTLLQSNVVTAYDADDLDEFGVSVAVDANEADSNILRLVVGGALNANSTGAIYAYRYWTGYGWLGQRYLPAADATNPENKFGYSVDIGGSRILIGAPDAERSGGASTPDLGTLKPKAGKFYSFSLTNGTTPPEVMPTSGAIDKVSGSDAPAPVVLPSTPGGSVSTGGAIGLSAGFFGSVAQSFPADERDDEWARLLRPVSNWTQDVPARFAASTTSSMASVDSYTDALLFDRRTKAGSNVLELVEKSEAVDAPQDGVPAADGEKASPDDAPEQPLTMLLHGFSTQLEAANGARSRDAQRLLASLTSLAS